jgi:dsDNA-specific endonuclease/ATPase MutS2
MNLPRDTFQMKAENSLLSGWRVLIKSIGESIDSLERGIEEAESMSTVCTPEWCLANERIMDELNNRIFSISEPAWASDEDSARLKALRRRLHDLYQRHRSLSEK